LTNSILDPSKRRTQNRSDLPLRALRCQRHSKQGVVQSGTNFREGSVKQALLAGLKARNRRSVLLDYFESKVDSKSVQTEETVSLHLAAIARRVCWWEPVAATLENTPLFLCRIMALGTWEDICIALDHYGRDAFREALQNAPPGLFDPRSWHYWHHRLQLLPVPSLPQRVIPA
jgi:hypothetical protein